MQHSCPDRTWLLALHTLRCSPNPAWCCRFLEGDLNDPVANSRRHNMLKLIPSVPQGSWIIKQSVGSTPVLLGNKISTTYHRYHSLIQPAQYTHIVVYILNRSSLYSMYIIHCCKSCVHLAALRVSLTLTAHDGIASLHAVTVQPVKCCKVMILCLAADGHVSNSGKGS